MKLRIKLCLVATGPMCIAVLLQILYFATDSERRTIDTLSEKARSLTPLLINLVGPNLALDDLAATAEVLGYVKKDPDFYAAAVVRNGKVVAEVGDVAALARATDLSVIPASLDVQVHGTTVVAQARIETGAKVYGTIVLALRRMNHGADRRTIFAEVGIGIGAALLAALTALVLGKVILGPVQSITGLLEALARGDLKKTIKIGSNDEIGQMGRLLKDTTASLRSMILDVLAGIRTLANSSKELNAVSSAMATSTGATSENVSTMAAAAEQLTLTVTSVARAMGKATDHLGTVSTGMQKIASTLCRVAQEAERARSVAARASEQASSSTQLVSQLRVATTEIGKVTETITRISDQTNLLALNATIEASRAGVAGRGFAVVASEIKDLSRQTAEATRDIGQRIQAIQDSTVSAVGGMESVITVNREVSQIVETIADSISKESEGTTTLARHISEAVQQVEESNGRLAECPKLTRKIAEDAAAANSETSGVKDGAVRLLASSAGLEALAKQLKTTAERFDV